MTTMPKPSHFIEKIISNDLATPGKLKQIVTRFPPEPNGFLHIGHAKAICLNFGIAEKYNGRCHLRFDDTNPLKESQEYIDAIQHDIEWLGFRWDQLCYASDYFPQLYEYAKTLLRQGQAFVCQLNQEEIRMQRGTLTQAGTQSPYRNRSVEENLELFERMRNGEFGPGEYVVRAKIDMAAANINMRDPVIYRILHADHHRCGSDWCIYPTYDFTHCLSDAIEGITHSLCTLEFEDHRPLYDWFLQALNTHRPQQIEFARLQLEYTLTSKRKLHQLIKQNVVTGWDDPRLPTLAGLRKRGIPPAAIREFCERIGMTKKDSQIEIKAFNDCVRDFLNETAPRSMAVIKPLKVIIDNYPDKQTETIEVARHPKQTKQGKRKIHFSRTIYIEQSDFMENATADFYRLSVGRIVKLRYAYMIQCDKVIKDENGKLQELHCRYLPKDATIDGKKIKPKGIIHWLSEVDAIATEARLYGMLFKDANPDIEQDIEDMINRHSLQTAKHCLMPKQLLDESAQLVYQFERLGYFYINQQKDTPILYRVIDLRDSKD